MSSARHVVFGTAGHVDHGKSALVRALTGTDPDRLAEEKAREMTIDLGFAFLALPGFESPVAIVDVPGHEMFVRNMVAGATGIDAAIFLVAADEGVMPQTVEHLDVLSSLKIPAGVIALSKVDRVPPARLPEVRAEIKRLVESTFLEGAAIVPVSAATGEGLPELMSEIARIAEGVQLRPAEGIFRLPIDRVFTIKGTGTVVTGTVVSGSLRVGERVACLPQGRLLRARGLHVQNRSVGQIAAGQRAAVNLADIEKEELQRGDVLATPGALTPTLMLDARVDLTPRAPRPLGQRTRLRLHHGTREVMARIVLLGGEKLAPGESALAQLRLESPIIGLAGDPFVLRSYSPMQVIGGGVIIDAHPPKRRQATGAAEVQEREAAPAAAVILQTLHRAGLRGAGFENLCQASGLSPAELRLILEELQAKGQAHIGRRDTWFSARLIGQLAARISGTLADLHRREPLRPHLPLNLVPAAMALRPDEREGFRLALESLISQGTAESAGDRVRLTSHRPEWSGRWAAAREAIFRHILGSGVAGPSAAELAAAVALSEEECREVLEALLDSGEIQQLAPDIWVHPEAIATARSRVTAYLEQHPRMTIADARALLGASRKYLLPFLEELDREGVTIRQGDCRVLARHVAR